MSTIKAGILVTAASLLVAAPAAATPLPLGHFEAHASSFGGFTDIAGDLSQIGRSAELPKVATAPSGMTTVVWQRSDGSNSRIQARTIDRNGYMSPTVTLSAAGRDAYDPRVAITTSGISTIIWSRNNGLGWIIQGARMDAHGKAGAAVNLSASGQNASGPQVSVAASGTATIAWLRSNGVNTIAQAVRWDTKGRRSAVLGLSAAGQDAHGLNCAVTPSGTSTIAWFRYNGAFQVVQAVRIDPLNRKGSVLNISAPDETGSIPQVSSTPSGVTTIAWSGGGQVRLARIDAKGKKGAILKPGDQNHSAFDLSLGVADNGTATIACACFTGAIVTAELIRVDAAGKEAAPIRVTTFPDVSYPRVAVTPGGLSTVAWERSNGSKVIIQAVRLTAKGQLSTTVDLSPTWGDSHNPAIAVTPAGVTTVSWDFNNGSYTIIQAIREN
ncbi:MAG: hypothetical protein NTX07_06370 [Solirubrobacterales bacterium]|nr:hypothetical protein [Solirubrobacterales bacterium]